MPCNCFCYLFIVFIVSSYLFIIYISDNLIEQNFINKTDQLYIGVENEKSLIDTHDGKDRNGINYSTAQDREENDLNICYISMFVMSMCMFLFCNIFPEYCFRKRIKLDKCQHVIVEKECGCTIMYKMIKEP